MPQVSQLFAFLLPQAGWSCAGAPRGCTPTTPTTFAGCHSPPGPAWSTKSPLCRPQTLGSRPLPHTSFLIVPLWGLIERSRRPLSGVGVICWAPPSLRIYVCIFCDCIQNILVEAELPPAGFILFYYFISCYYAGPTEGAARPPSHRGRSAPSSSLVLTAAAAAASVSASVSAVPAVFPVPAAPCPPSRSSTATTASWPMPPRRRGRCGGEAACGAWPGLAAPGARVAPRAGPGSSALREGVAGGGCGKGLLQELDGGTGGC